MKSASQMKSNPPPRLAAARSRSRSDNALRCHSLRSRRFATREAGFHHEVISSTEGGFLPPEADFFRRRRISVPARGLESRRCDAKPRKFRLCYALRSVAALTRHRHPPQAGILHRSPSSPVVNPLPKQKRSTYVLLFCFGAGKRT